MFRLTSNAELYTQEFGANYIYTLTILIDGTTDRAVKEQKVMYVMYVYPETHKPNFSYFEVIEGKNSS